MICGLLGKTLSHSYSPKIHSYLGNYTYALFEKKPEELADFLQNGDFHGINVTMPYKKDVIPYCHELTDCAKKLGAVNTIIRHDGKLIGHNTDYFGFSSMVQRSGVSCFGKKALVLGSGGASVTAVAVLKELGADVIVISRTGENNYDNLHQHNDAAMIVNATPVGMYPNTGVSPVDLDQFPELECVLDIVYNPARTKLLQDAESMGIHYENGLWMLIAQAKEAAEWFTGTSISDDRIAVIHKALKSQTENIILIGMPGSGKSTIGQMLAQRLCMTFVDADFEIIKMAGKTIPEIFHDEQEAGFRRWETQALSSLGKESGLVIATGGGCVTREENYPLLHQNGTIYWIERDISLLPTDGRPLSQAGSLSEMYRIRKPMYELFADVRILNNSTPENAVEEIIRGR